MASSAPPFSAGTESEPILRPGPFSFPFMHRGVMSRRKQMDEKNPPQTISIFGYDNRRSTPTIRP